MRGQSKAAVEQVKVISRKEMAQAICDRLAAERNRMQRDFGEHGRISSCLIDDLLPTAWAESIYAAFPTAAEMQHRKTIREEKYVAAQMDHYHPQLEETIYAFQDPEVVGLVEEITKIRALEPDELLYAGGISLMTQGNFLNPHLDNSHDNERERYRVLNLLYYVTPGWQQANGGNLELWDNGPASDPREIISTFNRLVLMVTDRRSWHSVNSVKAPASRCCISNYYFSKFPAAEHDYFHVTSFRGRPDEPVKNFVLTVDQKVRMTIRSLFKRGVGKVWHVYRKDK